MYSGVVLFVIWGILITIIIIIIILIKIIIFLLGHFNLRPMLDDVYPGLGQLKIIFGLVHEPVGNRGSFNQTSQKQQCPAVDPSIHRHHLQIRTLAS